MKQKTKTQVMFGKVGMYVLLGIFLVISIFPFYWMLVGSTNSSDKMFTSPPTLSFGGQFMENLINLDNTVGIGRVLFNSLFVSGTYVVLALIVSSTAAYAFAKFDFKGRNVIFTILILSMMIPYQATLIPLFQMMSAYGLLNTYFALIAPQLCYPFAIFLMRQNFLAFPSELLESARLDGAGEFKIFLKIVLPSMKPALAATSIFLFMYQWNNFMWPLVAIRTQDMYTFPVALSTLSGVSYTDYGQMMMGISIATVPIMIFFLVLQRHFISGMLGSAVK
ncbi:carbohydrate ABC transporter permease [Salipaludibacillus agaradhaerens]|jgi:lactose/L-arabinose transport system permease protein|uniref:Carbohydrate ABC transporter permease n=1 Tax=Salipaludibacillus agaradhaerens TaxID=76935 RepID=A0A9Q4AXT1_SALAG|nr:MULTISPECIES: carbohydrate ABC transporter permease [Salipaludibacillus]UJW59132.1 carbohydrate ABC transporter permease [Bacillus sp. A116_S68]MCR6095038.1 carbohydrate ABC transporter permease [Salipaludibacillus agaradhaerens]MCR6108059.1 carbohydrate ABC transporter permease [Salipaludibacillus agaradhaerens]MCR6115404.1 carbohydrate ABC transporter permease [Salipaludibacillus agaradhaerens]MCR6120084.1 carbohydrate ABC transporter permease [Salipaludibacillus agaradhaerens]